MRKIKMLAAAGGAAGLVLAAVVGAAPASAGGNGSSGPIGGCPTGDEWNLVSTGFVLEEIDNGNFKDQNGDGYVCYHVAPGGFEHDFGFTFKDNTNKPS